MHKLSFPAPSKLKLTKMYEIYLYQTHIHFYESFHIRMSILRQQNPQKNQLAHIYTKKNYIYINLKFSQIIGRLFTLSIATD